MKRTIVNRKLIIAAICAAWSLMIFSATADGQKKATKKRLMFPPAVAATLKSECPDCVLSKATKEKENGVTIYDFEFKTGQGEMDVATDGSVINRETPADNDAVPAAAMEAIRKTAAGGKIKYIAKEEIRAQLKNGKVIKLDA